MKNDRHGYLTCYTIWSRSAITEKAFAVGGQCILASNFILNDEVCVQRSRPAEPAIQAHYEPLEGVF